VIINEEQTCPTQVTILCLALVVFCSSGATFSQTQGGTIVIVFYSHDKVIFAADSRLSRSYAPPSDDDCKLAALNNNVIVATAGPVVGIQEEGVANMAQEFAREEAKNIGPGVEDPAKALASIWVKRMLAWEQYLDAGFSPSLKPPGQKKEWTQVLFAGRLKSNLVLYLAIMKWDGQHIVADSGPINLDVSNPFPFILGKNKSQDAFDRLKNTNPPLDFHAEWDRDVAKAAYLAEKIIKTAGDETIKGPVDILELRRDGTICWVQRKKNCWPN
jgi:hypothetical protein